MKTIVLLILTLISLFMFCILLAIHSDAQCSQVGNGTTCAGPLQVTPSTPPSNITLLPADATHLCPSALAGTTLLCVQQLNGMAAAGLTADFGDGTGFHPVVVLPIANVTLKCPPGLGTIGKGFTSHKCSITQP